MKIPKARKLSSGAWFIQLRLGGQSIPVTARTEKECTRQAQMVKAEWLAGKREAPTKSGTLREAIDSYIDTRTNTLSPATLRGYDIIKRNRFRGIMDRPVSELTDGVLIDAVNAEAGICSAKTLKNSWGLIRPAIKLATGRDPAAVSLPQVVPAERAYLTADEIKVFLGAVKGHPHEIAYLLALSSLRRSEILALRWENVDLGRKLIRVSGAAVPGRDHKMVQKAENKNRSSTRVVPILIDQLQEALEAACKPSGLVVDAEPGPLARGLQRVCREAGLPVVGLHGLRHSFASLAYHLQVPEKITMEIGGWSDYGTMRKIYTHISQSDIKRYEDAFAGFYKNANENANGK